MYKRAKNSATTTAATTDILMHTIGHTHLVGFCLEELWEPSTHSVRIATPEMWVDAFPKDHTLPQC